MVVELNAVEAYIEPSDILYQALRESELTTRDVMSICESEVGTNNLLEYFADSDIQNYIEENDLEIRCNFKSLKKSIQDLTPNQRAEILWLLLEIEDEEIAHTIKTNITIPRMRDLISVKQEGNHAL